MWWWTSHPPLGNKGREVMLIVERYLYSLDMSSRCQQTRLMINANNLNPNPNVLI